MVQEVGACANEVHRRVAFEFNRMGETPYNVSSSNLSQCESEEPMTDSRILRTELALQLAFMYSRTGQLRNASTIRVFSFCDTQSNVDMLSDSLTELVRSARIPATVHAIPAFVDSEKTPDSADERMLHDRWHENMLVQSRQSSVCFFCLPFESAQSEQSEGDLWAEIEFLTRNMPPTVLVHGMDHVIALDV